MTLITALIFTCVALGVTGCSVTPTPTSVAPAHYSMSSTRHNAYSPSAPPSAGPNQYNWMEGGD